MINCRYLRSGLFAIALALTAGCRESEPAKPLPSLPATPADASRETPYALRLHWIGRERLSAESNATNFMAIWNMPESLRLQNQTLDKLSTAPSRFLLGQTNATNTASTLLRPLLEHIVDHESYLEIHRSTNGPFALALAVRLDAEKARLWESNLPAAMKSLAAVTSVAQSNLQQWALNTRDGIKSVQFTRTGDWVVFGLTASDNGLFNVLQQRLEQNGSLPSELSSGHWLKTEFDLNCLLQPAGFNWKIGGDPAVRMIVTGGGENVRTHAEVKFNRPLNLRFEPWTLPTNMVIEPLSSFTAVRGVGSWAFLFWVCEKLKI
ncbi:MAG TPA: hypothetical protein PKA41_14405 [Verrucomicrobiota bacterium]|nr:hypothetical protein [Verrucomicrobiota bacterium]